MHSRVALALEGAAGCLGDLDELNERLSALPDPSRQAIEAFLDARQGFVELCRVRLDAGAAADAGVLLLRAELTEFAAGLLAALRAGDVDADVLERALGHTMPLRAGVDDRTIAEGEGPSSPSPEDGAA